MRIGHFDRELRVPGRIASYVRRLGKAPLQSGHDVFYFDPGGCLWGHLVDRRKGFDTLFAAWKQLCANPEWDADLVVVGRGAELPQWQQRATEAGLGDRIQFLGFRSDVPDLLRAADCLVAPTRYEAYGLGVHEALCCGLPALVSATAGVAERYPDNLHTLLLPNPEDFNLLSSKLQQWREEIHDYRQIMGKIAQDLRTYTWNDMVTDILKKIESG